MRPAPLLEAIALRPRASSWRHSTSNSCLRTAKTERDEAVAQREIAGIGRWLIECRDELLHLHDGCSNLAYVREAKRTLTFEQAQAVDDMLIGILSTIVSEQAWKDAVQMAVRLARREAQDRRKIPSSVPR